MIGSQVRYWGSILSDEFVLNDRSSIDSNWKTPLADSATAFYYLKITSVDGIYGADISYESDPLPNDTGEISGDVIRRGKGFTISGVIEARDLPALEEGAQYLQHTFWEVVRDGGGQPRFISWFPLNRDHSDSNNQIYLKARVNNDLVVAQTLDNFTWNSIPAWSWTVGLRADDPRIYNWSDSSVYQSWQV